MIIAIIPARGGSKGIKNKNLQIVNGKSLVRRAVECCIDTKLFEHILVSTDSQEIKEEALKSGAEVPFLRSEELSGDRISDIQVLEDVVRKAEIFYKQKVTYLAMIQPTSPLRKSNHILSCYNELVSLNLDAVWAVSPVDIKYHPLKQLSIVDGFLNLYDREGVDIIARQQLVETYIRNGVCYFFNRDQIVCKRSIYGEKMRGIVIDDRQVSIDTLDDLYIVEKLLIERENNV